MIKAAESTDQHKPIKFSYCITIYIYRGFQTFNTPVAEMRGSYGKLRTAFTNINYSENLNYLCEPYSTDLTKHLNFLKFLKISFIFNRLS